MTDDDLVEMFERGALPPGELRHREHVQLAWIYLARHGRPETERRLLAGLQAFARRAGRPEKFDADLTRAWIAAIAEARAAHPGASFEEFAAARPELLARRSPEARPCP